MLRSIAFCLAAIRIVDFAGLREAFAAAERAREVAQRFPAPFRNIIEGR